MKLFVLPHACLALALSFLSIATARSPVLPTKWRSEIESALVASKEVIDPKLARTLLDNDFESGSANPWYDQSPANVNWRLENFSSPSETNSSAPRPSVGTNYMRATRNADLASGLAVLSSPIFTANPGDRVSFDFWIRSKRPEGNNLELVWIADRTEYLLVGLSQYSTLGNFEWRTESVAIPVDVETDGYLVFYGYCGSNLEDAIAIDNIVVESSTFTTPEPGTNCIPLLASVGTFTSPNYPANYSNNANICWLITGAFNINLNFTSFATEVGKDTLKIYLGTTTTSELFADLSGTSYPSSISQNTESMLLVFTSDSANTNKGFSINYQVTKAKTTVTNNPTGDWTMSSPFYGCDESIYEYSGTIKSPYYPSNYPNSVDCSYSIRVPSGVVKFTLTDLLTESGYDTLTVYDGPSTNNPILLSVSGTSSSRTIYSNTNQILVKFTTDGSNTYRGWQANFQYY